jgi:uncharacterized membrane-anchored protein
MSIELGLIILLYVIGGFQFYMTATYENEETGEESNPPWYITVLWPAVTVSLVASGRFNVRD